MFASAIRSQRENIGEDSKSGPHGLRGEGEPLGTIHNSVVHCRTTQATRPAVQGRARPRGRGVTAVSWASIYERNTSFIRVW